MPQLRATRRAFRPAVLWPRRVLYLPGIEVMKTNQKFIIIFRRTSGDIGVVTNAYGESIEFKTQAEALAHARHFSDRIYQVVPVVV
jgi:hypothetical protein